MPTVLNKHFENDDDRRAFFRDELRRRLPELRKLDGFPHGTDDDIIALSDPPYYTACPNPWLNEFVAEWEMQKQQTINRQPDFRVNLPYAADVSEGKNNPIYNAHSYHTKVPHPAIMRYLLHYTQPGDIVLDGFAGTGMTGVAAQLCGNPDTATKAKIENEWKMQFGANAKPTWGARKAILGDLSPVASFIAYNYNTPIDIDAFDAEARKILAEVEAECGWMYETKHTNGAKGRINYTVWSDVFTCPYCSNEIVFWEAAVDKAEGKVRDEFHCTTCNALHTKKSLDKTWITKYDDALGETIRQTKTVPVLINYTLSTKRFKKKPDADDLALIDKINNTPILYWFPVDKVIDGDEIDRLKSIKITNYHQLFSKRSNNVFSLFHNKTNKHIYKFLLTASLQNTSNLYRWRINGKGGTTSGTYYICSTPQENNVIDQINRKLNDFLSAYQDFTYQVISNSTANRFLLDANSIDYIFTDPPFGDNIMYSELNFLWEAWLKVKTNNTSEAIENKTQKKGFMEYSDLMYQSFAEYYRVLKPGKWMTVEFSNTSAAIWNSIQTALQRAGFVVANVAALDKQQGSFKAVTTTTAVKQDLVISCYKPSADFALAFAENNRSELGVWGFVSEHLSRLPVHIRKGNSTTAVIERSLRILYDRLISYYVTRSLPVPLDAGAFQAGVRQRFVERDEMFFLAEQAPEYDRLKATTTNVEGIETILFIDSEKSGITWLQAELKTPQVYSSLQPKWMRSIQSVRKGDALPELMDILEDNFLKTETGEWYLPDPTAAKDMEKLRLKGLLREFNTYIPESSSKKTKVLKSVRTEALHAGFQEAFAKKEYAKIVAVGKVLPINILQEDADLLLYYEMAEDYLPADNLLF